MTIPFTAAYAMSGNVRRWSRGRLAAVLISGAAGAGVLPAAAECVPEHVGSFHASDPQAFDYFGRALAFDGATAFVGTPKTGPGSLPGIVKVFSRTGDGAWAQQPSLAPADATPYNWFGRSLSLDGSTLAVGAMLDDQAGANSGSVYIFTKTRGAWTQSAKLVSPSPSSFGEFGCAVALRGQTLLVGEQAADNNAGAVHVYQGNGATWTFMQTLTPSDSEPGLRFGTSIACADAAAAITAPFIDEGASGEARVYIFRHDRSGWFQADVLAPAGDTSSFGASVALAPPFLAVGAPTLQDPDCPSGCSSDATCGGSVLIYRDTGSGWALHSTLHGLWDETFAYFGQQILMDDEVLLASHQQDSPHFSAVTLFHRHDNLTPLDPSDDCWSAPVLIDTPEPVVWETVGQSMAKVGDTVLVATERGNPLLANSGTVHEFNIEGCNVAEAACPTGPAVNPPQYILTDLGTLGGDESAATDLNNSLQVVGWSLTGEVVDTKFGEVELQRAFRWSQGVMQPLPVLANADSIDVVANAINERGDAVGMNSQFLGWSTAAVLWPAEGGVVDLLLGAAASAEAISETGVVLANRSTDVVGSSKVYTWKDGVKTLKLQGSPSAFVDYVATNFNEAGDIVGMENFDAAFLLSEGELFYAGGSGSIDSAVAVNEDGTVLVHEDHDDCDGAMRWDGGFEYKAIGELGDAGARPSDLNDAGWIVGASEASEGEEHGFLWIDGVMFDLNDLIDEAQGWTVVEATAINGNGSIAGVAVNAEGHRHAVLLMRVATADINGDGGVAGDDLGLLLGSWGTCPGCPADLNADGEVDGADLGLLLGAWTG